MNRRRSFVIGSVLGGAALATSVSAHAAPSVTDCLAANESAISLESDHKLRAEREQLLVCAAESCPVDIQKDCARQVDQLDARIPTIVFDARDAHGRDLATVTVTMDGQPFTDGLGGAAIAADPGPHAFTFTTPGMPQMTRQLVIREGEKDRREPVTFGGAQPAASPVAAVSAVPASEDTTSHPGRTERIVALSVGGLGVAGIVVGALFGAESKSKVSERNAICPSNVCTPDQDRTIKNSTSQARTDAVIADVGFIGGGVALAASLALFFTAPTAASRSSAIRVEPWLAPELAGGAVRGSF